MIHQQNTISQIQISDEGSNYQQLLILLLFIVTSSKFLTILRLIEGMKTIITHLNLFLEETSVTT